MNPTPLGTEYINSSYTPEELQDLSLAIEMLEFLTARLTTVASRERMMMQKLGHKSEAFAREALAVAKTHNHVVPSGVSVEGMEQHFALRDLLGDLSQKLVLINSRVEHSRMLAGADLMQSAMIIYRAMKSHGDRAGLGPILESMRQRFEKRRKEGEPPQLDLAPRQEPAA